MFFLISLVVLLLTVIFSQTSDQCTLSNSASTFTGRVTFTGYYFNSNTSATLSVKVINSGQTIAITGSVPSVGTLNITGPVYGYAASSSGGKLALWIGGLQGSSIGSTTISGTSQGTVTGVSLVTGTTTSAKALNINGISYLSSNGFHEEVVIAGTLSSALKYSCSYSG
jgi:hypothetical protein